MSATSVFSRGVLRVNARPCDTCIFGAHSPVDQSRVEQMVADAGDEGCIPCHHTLDGDEQAVCHGFYQLSSWPMRLALLMGVIEWRIPERWRP